MDGVLCEAGPPPDGPGWPLHDQPHLPAIPPGAGDDPGLPDPGNGLYAVYLDVWTRHVTADEEASLREAALGGPDTTTRARTVWQVRVARIDDDAGARQNCAVLHAPGWLRRTPRRLTAAVAATVASDDPCEITTSGGYTLLENQLYRVQVHEVGRHPSLLWSRENASVVAELVSIEPDPTSSDTKATLVLDRQGRDESLSFATNDLVELTSVDRELRGLPGVLARAGAPRPIPPGSGGAVALPVTWSGQAPASVAALGRTPLVRRWEGLLDTGAQPSGAGLPLEGGITVTLGAAGEARTGDYWLIPARTVRLTYGLSVASGTIDWPTDGDGVALAIEPHGPSHHVAPLGTLRGDDGGSFTLESDCRMLFPPLTGLVTMELLGGDGQEGPPDAPLPQAVRVVVRRGGLPVAHADVQFTASDGGTLDPTGGWATTDGQGVARVRWQLADPRQGAGGHPSAAAVQTLTVHLPAQDLLPVISAPDVTVSARVTPAQLVLLGGDGQEGRPGQQLSQPVRVAVRRGGLPVGDVEVHFAASAGGHVDPRVATPESVDAVTVTTDEEGLASVRWALTAAASVDGRPDRVPPVHALTASLGASDRVVPPEAGEPQQEVHVSARMVEPQLVLLGGDGQEIPPHVGASWLDGPVRVAARAGGIPVADAPVLFTTGGGFIVQDTPSPDGEHDPAAQLLVRTGADGIAGVRWILDWRRGEPQTIAAGLRWERDARVPDPVVVTARCGPVYLRLVGGGGQQVAAPGQVAPLAVEVVVDSPSGPAANWTVRATTVDAAARVQAAEADDQGVRLPVPANLPHPGSTADEQTGFGGATAAFWWQPGFSAGSDRDVLLLEVPDAAPALGTVRVAANLHSAPEQRPGVHITVVGVGPLPEDVGALARLTNDTTITAAQLGGGLTVLLDGPVVEASLQPETGFQPVRVELDVPYHDPDGSQLIGSWLLELGGTANLATFDTSGGPRYAVHWTPQEPVAGWLNGRYAAFAESLGQKDGFTGRLVIEGWAVVAAEGEDPRTGNRLNLNCQSLTMVRGTSGPIRQQLPTTDDVTGGRFVQWFRLLPGREVVPDVVVPDVAGMPQAAAEDVIVSVGLQVGRVRRSAVGGRPPGTALGTEPPAGTSVPPGTALTLIVVGPVPT